MPSNRSRSRSVARADESPEPAIDHEPSPLPPGATGILTIDLASIVANWRKLEKKTVPAECAAVVKADAYGCGIAPVTRALAQRRLQDVFRRDARRSARRARGRTRCRAVCARRLLSARGDDLAACNARPVISDLNELAEWEAFRQISGWRGEAALHVDTGMNRLGLTIADVRCCWRATRQAITDYRWS